MYEVFVSCADTTGVLIVTCLERGVAWLRLVCVLRTMYLAFMRVCVCGHPHSK